MKPQAARRWVDAVNAEGSYGTWSYAVVDRIGQIESVVRTVAAREREVA